MKATTGLLLLCGLWGCTSQDSTLAGGNAQPGACAAGMKSCAGTCVAFDAPGSGCGSALCTPCPAPDHAQAICVQGSCAIGPCDPGFGDCDHQSSNGCETDLQTSLIHCGACGARCQFPNTTTQCESSVCKLSSCDGTFKDCNGKTDDGCEAEPSTDPLNCGACGNACDKGAVCYKGVCASNGEVLAWLDQHKGGWCLDDYNKLVNLCGKVSVCHYTLCGDLDTDPAGSPSCYNDYMHEHERAVPFCCDTRFLKEYPDGIAIDVGFHYDGVSAGALLDMGGDTPGKRLFIAIAEGGELAANAADMPALKTKLTAGSHLVSFRASTSGMRLHLNGLLVAEGPGTATPVQLATDFGPGMILGGRISYWWEKPWGMLRFAPFLFHLRGKSPTSAWTLTEATEQGPDTLLLFQEDGVTGNAWTPAVGPQTAYAISKTSTGPVPVWKTDAAGQCF